MTVYNGERFLGLAVESILAQTFGDFDFHIVDDGSTDGTPAILDNYARVDRRIIVHRQPSNTGLVEALNRGCRAVSSPLMARMDADDVSLPDRFARQIAYLNAHPDVGVLGTTVQIIDEEGHRGRVWPCPTQPGLVAWSLLFTCIIAHPSVMLRTRLLERVGFYPVGYTSTEDYALWMKLAAETRLANLGEVLVHYRELGTSLSRGPGNRLEDESVRIFNETVGNDLRPPLTAADVRMLRAFAQHRYPTAPHDLARLGTWIDALAARQTAAAPMSPDDVRAIRHDAGIRLWLLAFLALRSADVSVATKLAGRAFRLSPTSLAGLVVKAIRSR